LRSKASANGRKGLHGIFVGSDRNVWFGGKVAMITSCLTYEAIR